MNLPMTYLDNAASAPVRASALQAFQEAIRVTGNPDSVHSHGQSARAVLDLAREEIAALLGCEPVELIFTSGGTESVNLAIRGIFAARTAQDEMRRAIISSPLEHQAALESIRFLTETQDAELLESAVHAGLVASEHIEELIGRNQSRLALVSLMWANNETGAITDVSKVTRLAAGPGIPVHSDAVAALGKLPIDFQASGLAALSVCGHKIGAPVGIGALILRRDISLTPVVLRGGEQERGLRPGTTNYALAAAMAVAVRDAVAEQNQVLQMQRDWSEKLLRAIRATAPDSYATIAEDSRVAATLHVQLPQCDTAALVFALDLMGVSVSSGAACQAGVQGPSHVLLGMGYTEQQAARGLRISYGHATTEQDVADLLHAFPAAYEKALAATRFS